VESCDQALKINSKNADVWNIKGLDLLKLKEYEEALKCYNNALEFSPNFDEAWLNKSEVLAIKGKLSEAVKCAERAIEINPNRTDRWKVLGDLALKLSEIGKHTDALKYIDKSLQLEPLNSTLWNNKAAILMSLNKFAESEECSERALDINPKSAAAWLNKGSALLNLVKIEVEKGSKDVNGNFLKYFKLGMKLDPAVTNILPSQVKDFANDLSRLEQRDLGEDYAYKLLVNTPKYLQKSESETDNQFARKWTVIALGLFNRRFKLMFEGNPLEVERLELYQEVIEHALSDTFRDYENNPRQGFHVNTPNANYGIGKWVSELFPCDEDAQFENTISVLSDSLLPVLLPLIPDIKQELGKENEYDDKFNTAIPDVISILHENLCLLREEKQILKEHVYSQLKEYLLKRYFLEHHIENLKSTEKKIWVESVNALIEMGGIISMNDVVIKILFDTLKNENNDIKAKIAYILSKIGKTALTPALEALREENKEIQTHAIYILSKIGEPALKPLTALIDDENEIVRQLANICLEKIYEDSKNNSANEQ